MSDYANAKIVSYNAYGERVCAAAAKISTTVGNAYELIDASADSESCHKLIGKVLSSGHSSVIEHATFSLALRDVSVYVEQFFIEHRLASFTVKSRRYVNFNEQGYYIPPELDGEDRAFYCEYMDALFKAYSLLLDGGIPREDARFILPYSLCSNFYCTVNARELVHIIAEMEAKGARMAELASLARQLKEQLLALFPSLEKHLTSLEGTWSKNTAPAAHCPLGELTLVDAKHSGGAELISAPCNPDVLINACGAVSPEALIKSARPRALELLNYAFNIRDITLSGITHLARHRMQTLLVPELDDISLDRVIVPDSVRENAAMLKVYTEVVVSAHEKLKAHENSAVFAAYRRYFALSGTLTDVVSSMNARELLLFTQLRCCNRAQWEIRHIATAMLSLLRESYPALFGLMGPSCCVKGYCPEGRLTCGEMEKVIVRFGESKLV